ncbi:hypothetical protein PSAB6_10268 [Paraburkholderia sabiae]|nr:hypothetical protein PSAB6_10268 [Paraburkholderia sabiae]
MKAIRNASDPKVLNIWSAGNKHGESGQAVSTNCIEPLLFLFASVDVMRVDASSLIPSSRRF